jgi:DNA-directed RNA polymerase subunit RPC12/RpoP
MNSIVMDVLCGKLSSTMKDLRVTKDDERIRDKRSTGRKRGRAVLIKLTIAGERDYICANCGAIPNKGFEESSRSGGLDCQHINKNIMDCDPANLKWLCRICHYAEDRATDKGISTLGDDEFGYGI